MSSSLPQCNMSPADIMNKIYEIISIVQTLNTLIKQLNQMCMKSIFRFLFSILFYFTPQLNPYVWADAYEEAMKHREEQERARKALKDENLAKATGRETGQTDGVYSSSDLQQQAAQQSRAGPAL